MRAAVCPTHGSPDVVRIEDLPSPALAAGHLRVAISAAAVNFADVLIIANSYQLKVPAPFVPGSEFAGVVQEKADDVTGLAVGDRVFGTAIAGAFAEEIVVSAQAVRRVPDGVDLRTAAAFGVAHRTAYHALRSTASLQRGEELIVLGAAGGVGLAAVQLGAVLGASVTAVASSPERLEVASSYGARHLVDRQVENVREALRRELPQGADVVIDPVGGDVAEPALRALRWAGRFVTIGFASGVIPRIPLNLVLLKGVVVTGFEIGSFLTRAHDEAERNEAELMKLLASGRIAPHISASFDLEQAADALRYVGNGQAIGKVVVDVARDEAS
ncbi:MAG: NADPH:quinone oxidoreductase family protein [Actinomycetes bacterium]